MTATLTATATNTSLLIALNAAPRLQRAALCRLALEVPTLDLVRLEGRRSGGQLMPLAASLGVPVAQLRRAVDALPSATAVADAERRRAAAHSARIITRLDDDYPAVLLDHPLPPPVLYLRGELLTTPAIAIVGSRRMDDYGRQAAKLFAGRLATAGVTVVSGFALGVDATAHRAALDAGGTTVAVLGCGLDVRYPAAHGPLGQRIAERGAVITEYPFGCQPRAWHFPVRNRVIATLATGTLVVQAKIRSGSLITAHLALELGREVFAVPGSIFDELSMGTNALIADGAAPVSVPDDVLERLSLGLQADLFPVEPTAVMAPPASEPAPTGFAGKLLDQLPPGSAGVTADDLANAVGATVDKVLGALLELELGGWLQRRPGPVYVR